MSVDHPKALGLEIGSAHLTWGLFASAPPRLSSHRCKRTKDVGPAGSHRGASWQLPVSSPFLYQGSRLRWALPCSVHGVEILAPCGFLGH